MTKHRCSTPHDPPEPLLRRPLLATTALLGAVGLAIPLVSSAAPDPLSYTAHGEVLNILPPGSNGNVDAQALATLGLTTQGTTANGTTPSHFADQLEMYDGLNRANPAGLTDLSGYYKDARLGVADADVVSTETPRPGVTIKRDKYGVPHIFGATDLDVAFGSGYANIEDRMFLTDALRHTGAATSAELLGPSDANVASDAAQLRVAPYRPEEADAQIAAIVTRYGAEGKQLVDRLDAMIQGMNAAQEALCPGAFRAPVSGHVGIGLGERCPVEYAALNKSPEPYTRADIVAIASLVGGIFGKGGGGEAANARWLQQLQAKLGVKEGRRVFDDLREKNDPEAPVTSQTPAPYGGGRVDPDQPGVALPDLAPAKTAPGTGAVTSDNSELTVDVGTLPPGGLDAIGRLQGPFGPIDLGLRTHGMSNALLVDAKHSADGHPVVVFGPQTGYFAPQLLVEQDLEGPTVKARGVSFAGTNLVVELGHGVDYAWSATSASSDNVDTVVERLCNKDGSPATVDSTSYLVGRTCVPMTQYTHTESADPNVSAQAPPRTVSFLVLRTRHGIVQGRTTVKGKPVAIVLQRSTYGHEIDSAVGFARLANPSYTTSPQQFQKAVSAIDYTFNWFYADSKHIAYYCSGLDPVRAGGWDQDLPRWGDPKYDDRGFLSFAGHPRAIDPSQGYLVSWNNKPAPGFSAADNDWGYGPVYRSRALEDRIRAGISGGARMTREKLVGAMIDAATVDVRGAYVLPTVLDVLGTPADPQDKAAVALLRAWVAKGAHRVDRARTGAYADQAAVALVDAWWDPVAAGVSGDTLALPKEVLRGGLGDLVDVLPRGLDDHPRLGVGSAFNDVAWYGYVSKDLRRVLHRREQAPYSRVYCGTLATCRSRLLASLDAAVKALLAQQKQAQVTALTYDKTRDDIRSVTAGVVGVRPIDWQNRPTFQQVIHFTSHR